MTGRVLALLIVVAGLAGCAHTPPDDPADPLEPVNRAVFTFNRTADRYVMRPVAKTYVHVVPQFARTGIHNFFGNLFYPTVIVNDLLQLKLKQTWLDFARLFVNTTAGFAGFYDFASRMGLQMHDEDFGQTLGYWGVGPGWYLMLPLLGPSDNRDLIGSSADAYTGPLPYLNDTIADYCLVGMHTLDMRAELLGSDRLLDQQFDPYVFVRTAYLQHRQYLVFDGNPPKEQFDFGDDDSK